ncbi:MAG TPA: cytochrome c oxidase subunit II [Alphaproteobacteria bacterium]|nr:cytochrome c oxidase subunit II [Alphaproteobacteria bacterium]
MSAFRRFIKAFAATSAVSLFVLFAQIPAALADSGPITIGEPHDWAIAMQKPYSPVEVAVYDFHNILLWLIFAICAFVLALLLYVIVRYNKYANPKPSNTAHNTKLEIAWTLVPCLILIALGVVSFPLLYYTDRIPAPDLTLKVTGHQWYWSYAYPQNGNIAFDSHAIWDGPGVTWAEADKLVAQYSPNWPIKHQPLRLLEVDNPVVLPVGKVVKVEIYSGDVEHSWFIPSLGINRMAVPGRMSDLWVKIDKPGIYYGECSMICGEGHAYMPIVVMGVPADQFAQWVKLKEAKKAAALPVKSAQFAAAGTSR